MLQLPGHTSHKLQPLDVAVSKSMGSNYSKVMIIWLRTNPGRKVTQVEVISLLMEAYTKSATINNAQNDFRATGMWPIKRDIFTNADFVASENLGDSVQDNNTSQNSR
ncbi:hypothetical protein ILUMI_02286 [Ignelater luminosus]|uniref:DDE-1 domain-containing protein n=1 Tax=Ignelater luminosus TaxID=2038154 RepID=A0A8K0DIE8_IGNLU|nr:hypothetical protein ILUMI_02286 [Ignelater luminosus]